MKPEPLNNIVLVLDDVRDEFWRAHKKHSPYTTLHEGYAVVLEELEELWEEIRRQPTQRDPAHLYKEAIQVASTASALALFIGRPSDAAAN